MFDLVSKVKDGLLPFSYGCSFNVFFSETTRPIELKFHMTTPYDWLVNICTNCFGHMTKMAATPIYGKNYLNIFFSGTKTSMALGLTM